MCLLVGQSVHQLSDYGVYWVCCVWLIRARSLLHLRSTCRDGGASSAFARSLTVANGGSCTPNSYRLIFALALDSSRPMAKPTFPVQDPRPHDARVYGDRRWRLGVLCHLARHEFRDRCDNCCHVIRDSRLVKGCAFMVVMFFGETYA